MDASVGSAETTVEMSVGSVRSVVLSVKGAVVFGNGAIEPPEAVAMSEDMPVPVPVKLDAIGSVKVVFRTWADAMADRVAMRPRRVSLMVDWKSTAVWGGV